jgi:elongation factor Ts
VTEISAAQVKELRDLTGAGMMDCKRALQECEGDLESARTLLREKGLAQAGKRAGRETTEGVVLARVHNGRGTLVAVGSETEPVANNEDFREFAEHVLDVIDEDGPEAASELEEERVELVAKVGENIAVRGASRYEAADGETVASYVHPPANKIGVLVKVRGGSGDAARRVAMHISSARPRYVSRDEIPSAEIEQERAIYAARPEVEGKPAEIQARIVDGMLQKSFFAETVLPDQQWIFDTAKTVAQALKEEGLEVVAFERYALAE